jgi:hypothetical protein
MYPLHDRKLREMAALADELDATMAIVNLMFTHVAQTGSGDAVLNVTDLNGNPITPGQDSTIEYSAGDGGNIIGLSWTDQSVTAGPVAAGTALVTVTAYEGGLVVTGTLNVTVATVSGKLQATWASGTITVH